MVHKARKQLLYQLSSRVLGAHKACKITAGWQLSLNQVSIDTRFEHCLKCSVSNGTSSICSHQASYQVEKIGYMPVRWFSKLSPPWEPKFDPQKPHGTERLNLQAACEWYIPQRYPSSCVYTTIKKCKLQNETKQDRNPCKLPCPSHEAPSSPAKRSCSYISFGL